MREFVEKSKQLVKLMDELGIISPRFIQIEIPTIVAIGKEYDTPLKLTYLEGSEIYNYRYRLYLEGLEFVAVSDSSELEGNGFKHEDFIPKEVLDYAL